MSYTGTQADADLKQDRDAHANYLNANMGNMSGGDQNTLLNLIAQIDAERNAIAQIAVLDAMDPTGQLFNDIQQATSHVKTVVDNLAKTQATVAKALTTATDVLSLAVSLHALDPVSAATAVTKLKNA